MQYMPMIGDIVLYFNMDDKIQHIVAIWNIQQSNFIRQGEYPLLEGELQFTGVVGQYIYLNKNGDIKFVDSTMLNYFQLTVNGFLAQVKNFEIDTYDGVSVLLNKDITITRGNPNNDTPTFTATIDDNGVNITNKSVTITIDNNNNFKITGANSIQFGDEPCGGIITTNTFPICPVTGQPIIGSTTVKAAG